MCVCRFSVSVLEAQALTDLAWAFLRISRFRSESYYDA